MRPDGLTATRDLATLADGALSARLMTWDPAPIAVAFSGGGDSLALLLAADTWAKAHGRRLLALTVDHGLRPESVAWTRVCQERARALGVDHRALAWTGDKPVAGVPAAARDARHRLLAEAAREAGAAVILMGHTADDCAEAAVMRRTGSTTPSPRRWSPSPVWPQGRGIFLLRPFLGVRRAALRAALTALGESWIDDPGNIDPGSARARARAQIAGGPLDEAPTAARARPPGRPGGLGDAEVGPAGNLFLPVRRLADPHDGANLLGAALLCAAGSERTPRRKRLQRLVARLTAGERFAATLAGARVESDGTRAHIVRDAGDVRRPAMEEIMLREGRTIVWDGRFEVAARSAGLRLGPLCGRAGRLTPRLREAIAQIPPSARRALPLAARADGVLSLPTLRPDPAVDVRPLAPARLAAARGAILDEGTLRRMAKSAHPY